MAQETDERLVNVTIMSTESDILREIDFAAIIKAVSYTHLTLPTNREV